MGRGKVGIRMVDARHGKNRLPPGTTSPPSLMERLDEVERRPPDPRDNSANLRVKYSPGWRPKEGHTPAHRRTPSLESTCGPAPRQRATPGSGTLALSANLSSDARSAGGASQVSGIFAEIRTARADVLGAMDAHLTTARGPAHEEDFEGSAARFREWLRAFDDQAASFASTPLFCQATPFPLPPFPLPPTLPPTVCLALEPPSSACISGTVVIERASSPPPAPPPQPHAPRLAQVKYQEVEQQLCAGMGVPNSLRLAACTAILDRLLASLPGNSPLLATLKAEVFRGMYQVACCRAAPLPGPRVRLRHLAFLRLLTGNVHPLHSPSTILHPLHSINHFASSFTPGLRARRGALQPPAVLRDRRGGGAPRGGAGAGGGVAGGGAGAAARQGHAGD